MMMEYKGRQKAVQYEQVVRCLVCVCFVFEWLSHSAMYLRLEPGCTCSLLVPQDLISFDTAKNTMSTHSPNPSPESLPNTNQSPSSNAPRPGGNDQVSTENIIAAHGDAFETRTGKSLSGDQIAQLLLQNMGKLSDLVKQGKLSPQQITKVSGCGVVLSPASYALDLFLSFHL